MFCCVKLSEYKLLCMGAAGGGDVIVYVAFVNSVEYNEHAVGC